MPRDTLLVLWTFAVDGFRFDTKAPVYAHFQLAEPGHDPAILGDRCVVVCNNMHCLCFVGAYMMETYLASEVAGLIIGVLGVEGHVEMLLYCDKRRQCLRQSLSRANGGECKRLKQGKDLGKCGKLRPDSLSANPWDP